MEKYTVTRQLQWPEETPVVEISSGGIDFTNPDALAGKYPGEFEEFTDPVEAVETAIEICKAWRKDGTPNARIGIGCTSGMTIPFDSCTFEQAGEWAKQELAGLEKCDHCGGLLPSEYFADFFGEGKYCCEFCAERYMYEETVNNYEAAMSCL